MDGPELLLLALFVGLLVSGMWIPFAVGIAAVAWLLVANGTASLRSIGLVSWSPYGTFVGRR